MSNQPIPAPLDLSSLPSELQGQWILLLIGDGEQKVISSGSTIHEVVRDQPTGPEYLLTRAPREVSIRIVSDERPTSPLK